MSGEVSFSFAMGFLALGAVLSALGHYAGKALARRVPTPAGEGETR